MEELKEKYKQNINSEGMEILKQKLLKGKCLLQQPL